ncbi:MAG: pirin family protein [Sneathiella sp.]|nr:pirin family protein [Sneathiella sp.]
MESEPVELIISGKPKNIGGFEVRRLLPAAKRRSVGPFVFLDHMGPAVLAPAQGMDVRPHPHIGLATVTYLYEGSILHRDNLGSVQEITPGDVNWMTAGRGIVHSERSGDTARAREQLVHGLQAWVALPRKMEEIKPSFIHYPRAELPEISGDGWTGRLIAGALFGARSPVATLNPLFFADIRMYTGAEIALRPDYDEGAVYVVSGRVQIGGKTVEAGELAVLQKHVDVSLIAMEASVIAFLGGDSLPEPRFMYWNFVSTSRERIDRAKSDWRDQRFTKISGESEFTPLPETH